MPKVKQWRQQANVGFENFRHKLADIDALPQLTVLGLVSGVAAALIIVAFRGAIQIGVFPFLGNNAENFESLSPFFRFLLPVVGALCIGLAISKFKKADRAVSVSHVLDRLHNHQGVLPWRNTFIQFFGGIASVVSGQSVGREGPAVHLGAGMASFIGQWLKLPNNSLRTLVSCGVAAAIAASFNTPMAGVIFAMEVVLMQYTVTSFIPVIIASVVGAAITKLVFGDESGIVISAVSMNSLLELPYIVFGGIVIATAAASFYRLQFLFAKFMQTPIVYRLLAAGILTGCVAIFVPQVMGVGYDTLNQALSGSLSLNLLLVIVVAKIVCTTCSIGLGVPGGLIGPSLFVGGCLGAVLGIVGNMLFPEQASNAEFYVILGMAAMMAAVLNAPLAALVAIIELTYNPNMIFAGMLMIVFACLTTRQVFKCGSIFVAQLELAGTPIRTEPAQQILSRVGVLSVMNKQFVLSNKIIQADEARNLLLGQPAWIVIEETDDNSNKNKTLLHAADLANYLSEADLENDGEEPSGKSSDHTSDEINLLEIPGRRFKLQPLHYRANLYEAHIAMTSHNMEAISVERVTSPLNSPVMGIITKETIENYYSR